MDGVRPAKVPDDVIREIRDRERNGAIELPKRMLKCGDRVRILAGPFRGHLVPLHRGFDSLNGTDWGYRRSPFLCTEDLTL
jgi:hypothetical protein